MLYDEGVGSESPRPANRKKNKMNEDKEPAYHYYDGRTYYSREDLDAAVEAAAKATDKMLHPDASASEKKSRES